MRILDQFKEKQSSREGGGIGHVEIIHLVDTWASFSFSFLSLSSSIIINSFNRPFIIAICSVQGALLAVLSGVGLCHRLFIL